MSNLRQVTRIRERAARIAFSMALASVFATAVANSPASIAAGRRVSFGASDTAIAGHIGNLQGNVVHLSAGSVDGLQDAIAAAGPGGVVMVQAGNHFENSGVLIDISVSIIGETGAIIESVTAPMGAAPPFHVDGALHVQNTENVLISGLELRPGGDGPSNTAVVIENSARVTVESNIIDGYTVGVVVQNGDRADLSDNVITLTGVNHGIVIVNGRFARITGNVISNASFAIWACDEKGHAARNVTTDSFIGIILCNVPPALEISGQIVGSEVPATGWKVQNNTSSGNFWGYAVTDGAHDNLLANNTASENGIDFEVLGDSTFFGFFTPAVYDNVIAVGSNAGVTVHDCGIDTNVAGNAVILDQLACF